MASRKLKLTNTICKKLEGPTAGTGGKEIEYTHAAASGLKFYVTATDLRGWRYRYTYQNKKRSLGIGKFPGISADEAINIAWRYSAALDRGQDPAQLDNVPTLQPAPPASVDLKTTSVPTFSTFTQDQYLPYKKGLGRRSWGEDESKIRVHMNKVFGHKALDSINRYEIELYLAKIAEELSPSTSNRHLALLSHIFNMAINWEIISSISPCQGIKKRPESKDKGRSFTPEEIRALYTSWHGSSSQQAIAILDLLLFTGLRLREIMHSRWENIDLDKQTLYLPKTKAGKPRTVNLSDQAIAVLRTVPINLNSPWVFPGKNPTQPVDNINKVWKGALKRAQIGHARIHDLRHHFGTTAANANVPPVVLQGLMGHASFSTTLKYLHRDDKTQRNAAQTTVAHIFGPTT